MCVFCFGSRHSITKQVIITSTVVGTRKEDTMYICVRKTIGKNVSGIQVQINPGDVLKIVKKVRNSYIVSVNGQGNLTMQEESMRFNFKQL